MHAEDDRYAKFSPFTKKEVEILCNNHSQVCGPLTHPLSILSLSLVKCWATSTALQWLYSHMRFWTCQAVQPFLSRQSIRSERTFKLLGRNW